MEKSKFSERLFKELDVMRGFMVDGKTQLVDTGYGPELSARNYLMLYNLYSGMWSKSEVEISFLKSPENDIYGNLIEAPFNAGVFSFKSETVTKMKTEYSDFNTKEFWDYLHSEWRFCDVMTHPNGHSLNAYRNIKGAGYRSFINNHINAKLLNGKKILEIGPGYGLFPEFLEEASVKSKYYCLDVVKRFEHDNFVLGNGMEFPDCINEKFDLVFLLDAYSHIPYESMENYVRAVLSMLSDDGVVMFNVPHMDNACMFFGTVTIPLPFKRLVEIADSYGFEVHNEKFFLTKTFSESAMLTIRRRFRVDN